MTEAHRRLCVYRLQSPMLTGLIRTDQVLSVSEPSALGTEDGVFHSYGFEIGLATLEHPVFAAGFARMEDAADERRRLLLALNSPHQGEGYNAFEDVALRVDLAPALREASAQAQASGEARYITVGGSGDFAVQAQEPEDPQGWYMVVSSDGQARIERRIEDEMTMERIEELIRDGALVPVNPLTGRHLRLES